MAKTGNQLISQVQLTITMPNNQELLTDARILAFCNEEIMSTVVPMIMSVNQEYFVVVDESETTEDGKAYYDIPYRAIGRILRDLKLKNPQSGDNIWNVAQIYLEDVDNFNWVGQNFGYHFQGDQLKLVPTPQTNEYTLMKYYFLRPNELIKLGDAGTITGISGNIVDIAVVPDAFEAGVQVDFIAGRQGNRTIAMDQTITNVSGTQITIADVPDDLQVGDYVSVAQTSPVLQLPDDVFSYLVYLTGSRCLDAIGDLEQKAKLDEALPAKRRALEQIFAPRNQGEQIKIVNRRGLVRAPRYGYWRGYLR